MAETPYLVDSNVLLRWVKPDHRDYPAIISAIDAILRHAGVLYYASQNVGEFWNACTRPADRNGYGLSPQETDRLARFFEEKLRLQFTKNGEDFWWRIASLACRFMTRAWWRRCVCTASSAS